MPKIANAINISENPPSSVPTLTSGASSASRLTSGGRWSCELDVHLIEPILMANVTATAVIRIGVVAIAAVCLHTQTKEDETNFVRQMILGVCM